MSAIAKYWSCDLCASRGLWVSPPAAATAAAASIQETWTPGNPCWVIQESVIRHVDRGWQKWQVQPLNFSNSGPNLTQLRFSALGRRARLSWSVNIDRSTLGFMTMTFRSQLVDYCCSIRFYLTYFVWKIAIFNDFILLKIKNRLWSRRPQ